VGRDRQKLEDLRRCVEYGQKSKYPELDNATFALANSELGAGNWSRGREMLKNLIARESRYGNKAAWSSVLAGHYPKWGDLEAANQAMDDAEKALSRIHQVPDRLKSTVSRARAQLLDTMGRRREAEAAHREAISLWEPHWWATGGECGHRCLEGVTSGGVWRVGMGGGASAGRPCQSHQ